MFFLKKKIKNYIESAKTDDFIQPKSLTFKETSFNNAYIVSFFQLAAELAKIDEKVNSKEIKSFSSNFPPDVIGKIYIEKLFIEACLCKNDYIIAVTKIESLFANNKNLLFQTFDPLLKIAISDHYLNNKEKKLLKYIFEKFQLGDFSQYLKNKFLDILNEEYSKILPSVKKGVNINHYYKQLIKIYHPDKFYSCVDIAEEYIYMIEERFKRINIDYHQVKDFI